MEEDDIPMGQQGPVNSPGPGTPIQDQAKKRKLRPSEEDYKTSDIRSQGIEHIMRTPPKQGDAFRRLEEAAGIRRRGIGPSRAGSKRNKSRKQKRKTKKHGRRK